MTSFTIATIYEQTSITSVILSDGDMIRVAEIERKAILRAWGARTNRDPFRYHDHLRADLDGRRRLQLSNETANDR